MATRIPTQIQLFPGVYLLAWTPILQGDTCSPGVVPPGHTDMSVHVYGTFGAADVIDIKGSNDEGGAGMASLREPGNALLSSLLVTANGNQLRQILEACRVLQPVPTGGDGTTSLTIKIVCVTQARR